jgi:hypothetical protein
MSFPRGALKREVAQRGLVGQKSAVRLTRNGGLLLLRGENWRAGFRPV